LDVAVLSRATHLFVRPLVSAWLATNQYSWDRHPVATDSPHVHARGTNPDRILIIGDGAATGRGVRTHDLGLPGYLARSLSVRTNRAADVDLVVNGSMTVRTGLPALAGLDLSRFDIIILSFGANETLDLMPARTWTEHFQNILLDVLTRAPALTKVFVLAIPVFGINPHFPKLLARVVDAHGHRLNTATLRLMNAYPEVVFVPESHDHAFELEGAHLYRQWAEEIASRIADNLDPARPKTRSTEEADEKDRQDALERFETISRDRTLDLESFTQQAKNIFGTEIAAITIVRSDTETMRSITGTTLSELPRAESFCDVTIRRTGHLVIHDATLDNRYADYTLVTGPHHIRFYAGYPLQDPQGHRIGALCLMDTRPTPFTDNDADTLRTLALRIQKHIYDPATS
jgi:GAF domain-containing protein